MFRHKFLRLTLILGLSIFSGCSSSSSSDDNTPSADTTSGQQEANKTVDTDGTNNDSNLTGENPVNEQTEEEKCKTDNSKVWNGTSCENNIIEEDNITKETIKFKSMFLSGIAIDGYIHGAKVKIGDHEAISDVDGKWSLELKDLDESYIPKSVVTVSGGIDTATGKVFEGVLSNAVETDDFKSVTYNEGELAEKPMNLLPIVITPLTTIVVHTMKNSVNLSKAEANQQVAKSLGLSTESLSSDPIAALNSDDKNVRLEAAKALKHSLIIQKITESLSKSVSDENSQNGIKFDEVFGAVLSTVAEKLQEAGGEAVDFEKTLSEDSDAFAKSVTTNIQKDSTLSDEDKIKQSQSLNSKLSAATQISSKIVTVISAINIDTLAIKTDSGVNQFEMISQATEVITSKIETKIESIAQADSDQLDDIVQEAKDVANAVVVMGGINTFATQIETANTENNLTSNQQINTNQFDSLLSDNLITENSNIYKSFEKLGISAGAILDAVNNVEENGSVLDLAVKNQNVIANNDGTAVVDTDKLDEAKTDLNIKITEAQTNFNTEADKIEIVVTPICNDNQELQNNICVDKVPVCTTNQELVNNVCVDKTPVCTDNQELVNNICVDKIPVCTDNQELVNNICIDKTDVVTTQNTVTCSAPLYVLNSSKDGCIYIAPIKTKALVVTNNQVTFKSENNTTTIITTSNGEFADQKFEDLNKTSSLQSISFKLGEEYFQSGDKKTIAVAIKIEDLNSSLAIIAIVPEVVLTYNSGYFSIDGGLNKTLYGYGIKSNGTALSTSVSSKVGDYLTFDNSSNFTLNYKTVLEKIEKQESIKSVSSNLDTYLSKAGSYRFSIYISGVDKFTGMKAISDSEMVQSFDNSDFKNNIKSKLISSQTFGIVGKISIK